MVICWTWYESEATLALPLGELAAQIGNSYAVRVASSDSLVQLSSFRSGVLRMSARELHEEVENAHREMGKYFRC